LSESNPIAVDDIFFLHDHIGPADSLPLLKNTKFIIAENCPVYLLIS
jgi:hypothetical protein